jgi:hypothetical protein
MSTSAYAYLVESIPKGLEDLRGTPGVAYTEDVLVQLTSRAKSSIDLTAMYWALRGFRQGVRGRGGWAWSCCGGKGRKPSGSIVRQAKFASP